MLGFVIPIPILLFVYISPLTSNLAWGIPDASPIIIPPSIFISTVLSPTPWIPKTEVLFTPLYAKFAWSVAPLVQLASSNCHLLLDPNWISPTTWNSFCGVSVPIPTFPFDAIIILSEPTV